MEKETRLMEFAPIVPSDVYGPDPKDEESKRAFEQIAREEEETDE
jgi:hypothetical protein